MLRDQSSAKDDSPRMPAASMVARNGDSGEVARKDKDHATVVRRQTLRCSRFACR